MNKLIVGLGNPGIQYYATRHNIGFDFIDFLADKYKLPFKEKFHSILTTYTSNLGSKIIFAKPQTYMNKSGESVHEIAKYFKISPRDIIVVFDDLDLREGKFKIQSGSFPKEHNGINNVILHLDSISFIAVRVGVDGRSDSMRHQIPARDYVLSKYTFNYLMTFEEVFLKLNSELSIFV